MLQPQRATIPCLARPRYPPCLLALAGSMDYTEWSMDYRWLEGHELYDYGGSVYVYLTIMAEHRMIIG